MTAMTPIRSPESGPCVNLGTRSFGKHLFIGGPVRLHLRVIQPSDGILFTLAGTLAATCIWLAVPTFGVSSPAESSTAILVRPDEPQLFYG